MIKYKGTIKSKLPEAGASIFSIMSSLAAEHGAINLSQGFPDFPVSSELIDLVHEKMKEGHNQYSAMPGLISLRRMIAEKMLDRYQAQYDAEKEITITAGGTQAIYTALTAFVQQGDEVILFEPAYDCYLPAIKLCGGIPVPLPLHPPGYQISWDDVRKAISPRTKIIMINSPHNPTGAILTDADIRELKNIVSNTNIIILSDEVYEHVIFEKNMHRSMARYPELTASSIIIFSFGKTFHATGWKIGYAMGPEKLMEEFRRVHQFNVFSVNTPLQHALAEFMKNKDHYDNLGKFYQGKRDFFLDQMKGSRFQPLPCHGSYFQLMDYSEISSEKDTEFAKTITREFGVAAIPVSVFYTSPPDQKLLRFCFAKKEETLKEAAARLQKI